MNARTRALIKYGELCGFTLDGVDGRGHYRMTHPNGSVVRISATPGEYKGDANCEADMRRKSGVTPVRPGAGRFTFLRRQGFNMRHALAEKDETKSGFHRAESEPVEFPFVTDLRTRLASLERQIESTPYPYLIQERRRIEQQIAELTRP